MVHFLCEELKKKLLRQPCKKITNPICATVFSQHFAVHICRYNMNLVTVLGYLKCTNSAIYFL